MKNRLLITFSIVVVLNALLEFFLIKFNCQELGLKLCIGLLIGSYIVYFLVNLYMWILKSNHQDVNYSFTLGIGITACLLVLILLLINSFKDKILFFPMMYIVSMSASFISWFINDWKEKK